jgi:hypothetical protein
MVDLLCKPDCQSRVPAGITTKEDYVKSLLPDKLVLTGYDSIATRARLSAILLGLIIEKVAGTTFEDYVHSHIFLPLQLNASYDLTQARQQGLAKGYIYASGDLTSSFTLESKPYTMPAVFNPYTGLVMSSSDLAKFLMTLLSRDTKILSTDTWTRLLSASSDLGLFRGLVSESYTINGQDAIFLLCTLENASLKIDIFPATNEAQLSLVNWQSYEAIEGLHTPLFIAANILLNEPANATEDIDESLPNPKAEIMAYVAGKYSSPVGPIELYGLGEELHGKIMGHNFVLKLIEEPEKGIGWGSFSFQSRSDYKVFNGLRFLLDGNDIDLFTSYTHFAYRIDAEE